MSDSRPGWERAVDAVAAALCEQEETAQRDCDEPWSAWGTDRLAEFVSEACYGTLVEALTTQLTEQLARLEVPPGRSNGDAYSRGFVAGVRSVRDGLSLAAGLATPKETR